MLASAADAAFTPPYSPTHLVKLFHSIPRYTDSLTRLGTNVSTSGSAFDPLEKEYLESVLVPGALLCAITALAFLAYAIAAAAICCCCARRKRTTVGARSGDCGIKAVLALFAILVT
jgi:hypothetical protein